MLQNPEKYARFADKSFSWDYIEAPAIDRATKELIGRETKILDVGCGAGRVIGRLIQNGALEYNITALEPNRELLDMALERFPLLIELPDTIQATKHLPQGFYDLATANMVLHYEDNDATLVGLKNVFRSLKPGGRYVSIVGHPDRYDLLDKSGQYNGQEGLRECQTPWGGVETFYQRSQETYQKLFEQAGFRVDEIGVCPIEEAGKTSDPQQYDNYAATASRLGIVATRP